MTQQNESDIEAFNEFDMNYEYTGLEERNFSLYGLLVWTEACKYARQQSSQREAELGESLLIQRNANKNLHFKNTEIQKQLDESKQRENQLIKDLKKAVDYGVALSGSKIECSPALNEIKKKWKI